MQAHPEAPPLRVKTLPDYWKWSVIFAAESSDTRYVHLAHNEDHSSELPMYITGLFFTLLATVRHYLG